MRRAPAGLGPVELLRRPVADANPMAIIAAHVVDAWTLLVRSLGGDAAHSLPEASDAAATLAELDTVPKPAPFRERSDVLTRRLEHRLSVIAIEALAASSGMSFPTGNGSVLGAPACLSSPRSHRAGHVAALQRALRRGSLPGV